MIQPKSNVDKVMMALTHWKEQPPSNTEHVGSVKEQTCKRKQVQRKEQSKGKKEQVNVNIKTKNFYKKPSLRLICKLSCSLKWPGEKKPKVERRKSILWRKYNKNNSQEKKANVESQSSNEDAEIHIELSTRNNKSNHIVQYNFKTNTYQLIQRPDHLLHLLTLPSSVVHRDELYRYNVTFSDSQNHNQQQESKVSSGKVAFQDDSEDSDGDAKTEGGMERSEEEEDIVSSEKLALLDAQCNPFNFSERVSQTTRYKLRDAETQTDPPPENHFSAVATFSGITNVYKLNEGTKQPYRTLDTTSYTHNIGVGMNEGYSEMGVVVKASLKVAGLHMAALIVERMVVQNITDHITQDFMYWEDEGDDYHPDEGSLLPLWRFCSDSSKHLTVTELCWSLIQWDVFVVAYTADNGDVEGGGGLVSLYSLKNPSAPERSIQSSSGVTSVHLHPTVVNMVVCGCSDGGVVVYNVCSRSSPITITSSPHTGKHIMPVTQVRWMNNTSDKTLIVYSVALDGRLTQWHMVGEALVPHLIVHLPPIHHYNATSTAIHHTTSSITLPHERGTCIAFSNDGSMVVLGGDSGWIYQYATSSPTRAPTGIPAHSASVSGLAWNHYHHQVFISCSLDWTAKLWKLHCASALMVLDLGNVVSSIQWSWYSSSVFVAATEEGTMHVYDLFQHTSYPLCKQRILNRKQLMLSSLSINPSHPIVLVGGERGYVLALKLSPNLRKVYTTIKGCNETSQHEIELHKLEKIIALRGASASYFENPEIENEEDSDLSMR